MLDLAVSNNFNMYMPIIEKFQICMHVWKLTAALYLVKSKNKMRPI